VNSIPSLYLSLSNSAFQSHSKKNISLFLSLLVHQRKESHIQNLRNETHFASLIKHKSERNWFFLLYSKYYGWTV